MDPVFNLTLASFFVCFGFLVLTKNFSQKLSQCCWWEQSIWNHKWQWVWNGFFFFFNL